MQEYKRRQFRGHPLSLAGKSLRTEGFRGVLASRAQLGLEDQLRFENNVPTIPFETEIRDSRMSSISRPDLLRDVVVHSDAEDLYGG